MRRQKKQWGKLLYDVSKLNANFNKSSQVFFKSHIVDSVCAKSIKDMEYVDAEGFDYWFRGDYKVSGKVGKRVFGTEETYNITVTNIRGKQRDYIKENFDAMLIMQTEKKLAVAVVPFLTVCEYKKGTNGQIMTKIPLEELDFIIHPDEDLKPCQENELHDVELVFERYVGEIAKQITGRRRA